MQSKETFRNVSILKVLNRHKAVQMATTLEMATYLVDCLSLKRNAERECPSSVL